LPSRLMRSPYPTLFRSPVELWLPCRMTHCFSLGTLLGIPGAAPLADHGVTALTTHLRDAEHGGWFSTVGADGPVNEAKEAYAHADRKSTRLNSSHVSNP